MGEIKEGIEKVLEKIQSARNLAAENQSLLQEITEDLEGLLSLEDQERSIEDAIEKLRSR